MASQSTIELIKILRDRTGAGMMDCKKALEENNSEIDASIDWLRKKGIAKASAKSSRIAAEGLATVKICECSKANKAVIVEVNSETDFVAKSDAFKDLVEAIADIVLKNEPKDVETANGLIVDLITDATVKLGEKLSLRRFEVITKKDNQSFGSYIHMGGKIAVLLVSENSTPEINKGVAMHVACNAPSVIRTTDIPLDVREREANVQKELIAADERLNGKAPAMLEKILAGKIDAALNEGVLYEQGYLLTDGATRVGVELAKTKTEVLTFVRYKVGEGIEKREDNFAEEVLAQTK